MARNPSADALRPLRLVVRPFHARDADSSLLVKSIDGAVYGIDKGAELAAVALTERGQEHREVQISTGLRFQRQANVVFQQRARRMWV